MSHSYNNPACMLAGFTRDLSAVPRWVILRTKTQSVAEHSFFVSLYTKAICDMLDLTPRTAMEVMSYALTHDLDETISGDIPAPWRRHYGISAATTPAALANTATARFGVGTTPGPLVQQIVKVADVYEAAMFLAGEMSEGNKTVKAVLDELLGLLQEAATDLYRLLKGDERMSDTASRLGTTLRDNVMCECFRMTQSY